MELGKQYTIADDKGPAEVLIYEKEGVFISSAYVKAADRKRKIFGKATYLVQSQNGQFIIAASDKQVLIYNVKQEKVVAEREFTYIYSITLSSAENFVQILEKININQGKTILFSFPTLTEVAVYKEDHSTGYFNRQHFPLIKFNSDDSQYFRYNSKSIQVYSNKHILLHEISSGLVEFFSLSKISKGQSYFLVAVYLDKKTNQGKCEIFTDKANKQAIYKKQIKKADQIKINFSPTSNQFLMQLQTYFDPTGKSYYGEYGLFIYHDNKNKISSVKTQNGPVHDFSWNKAGDSFIAISGFMPASIKMFSKENQQLFDFGKRHRNTINWGNLGRFICFSGFGNLTGQIQVWDLEQKRQIGYCKSSSASYCKWSLDDRKILTAIVTPRLRVDNCFRVFSYSGTELGKVKYEDTELYGVFWLNIPNYQPVRRGVSPGRRLEVEPKKQEGKFKTFASSMNFSSLTFDEKKQEKPKLVPGQFPDQQVHKKKRRKKNYKEVDTLGPS